MVNYVEVMQLLGTSSCISQNVTPHEGLVQIRQSCADAVGSEAKILRRIGAVPMLYLVWLEGMKGVRPLTQQSDGLLTRLRQSYNEQFRRMSTPPTTLTLNVTLSDDLECCVPSGIANLLVDAGLCATNGSVHTAEELNRMRVESLRQVLRNSLEFEKMYCADVRKAYEAALLYLSLIHI